ncbi:MAG: YczE/YyaS/YitT family protein [Cellulosilyticaceae bacterium]
MKQVDGISSAKKWTMFFVGLLILNLGVALLLEVNIGSDPFTLFTQGMAAILNISPGSANRIITAFFLVILFYFNRKSIQLGTFLCMLFGGFMLDLNLALISPLQLHSYPFLLKVVFFMIACIVVGIGFPILKYSDLGIPPNDLMYFLFMEKLNKPYSKVRMVCDGLLAVVGYFLGGVVGVGTILCILLIGPIVGFFMPKIAQLLLETPYLESIE